MATLGIGLAAVGRPAYITVGRERDLGDRRDPQDLRRATYAVLDAAYDEGVRYLDAARSYGRAEEFLAGWLALYPGRQDVVVGSKWGYRYVGDWRRDVAVHEVKDHSLAAFTEQVALTRSLLGQRLSVYHVHSAALETGVLEDVAVHRALARLRDQGIRVGISTSGPAQAETVQRALDVEVDGRALFTSFQTTWNVLESSAGPALADAAAAGASVIVKEALANGRLVDAGWVPAGLGSDLDGVSPDRLAIAAALAQPWASIVLSGAVTPEQVRSNAAAREVTLDRQSLERLSALAEPPREYWAARSRRSWS